MGKAIIKENIGGGEYLIELVIARDRVDAELIGLNNKLTELQNEYPTFDEDRDKELLISIASVKKRIAYIEEHIPENQETYAHCVDFTDDLAVDAIVGTIEIARSQTQVWKVGNDQPYQYTAGIWIRPGYSDDAAYSAERDGILNPPINQNPWQLFYNWAMMPPSQKWKPRYRRAIINNLSGNYADITLTDLVYLTEDETEIDIDQTLGLLSVPIEYMDCDGDAFSEGNAVIVEFNGQEWTSAKIIGFYSAPRECENTYYYSILFQKQVSFDSMVTQQSDIFEKKYLKVYESGALEWVESGEAAAQCISDDCFSGTKQRPFSGVFYWEDQSTYNSGMFDIWCESDRLNPDGEDYKTVPYDFGLFTKIYSQYHQLAAPKEITTIFNISEIEVNIWQSHLAIGIGTNAGTYVFLKNNVRKVETESWKDERDGYYLCKEYETYYHALPREIGIVSSDICRQTGFFDHYYIPPVANGGYVASDSRSYYNEIYTHGTIVFGRDMGKRNTFWWLVGYGWREDFTDESVAAYLSPYRWNGPHPGGIEGGRWLNYTIGRRDGTISSDDFDAWIYGTFNVVSSIPSPPRNAGSTCLVYSNESALPAGSRYNVYVCPCTDGPVIVSSSFVNPGYDVLPSETIYRTMTGTLPVCKQRWTRETVDDGGELVIKNIESFPSAGEHYTEGQDIEEHVSHYFGYCGDSSGEDINSIYYSLGDEDHPTENDIYLIINYSQTNDDADGHVDKHIFANISKLNGEVVFSLIDEGSLTGDIEITEAGESIYPELLEMVDLTNALNNKKIEIGANYYNICRLMRK